MIRKYNSYKDSGVEWIGEIPSHWEVVKLKRLTKIKRGSSPRPIDDPKYFDDFGEYKWVRISDVSKSERYLLDTTETLSELGSSLSTKIYPNDLFLSIAGSVGKPIISKVKCCIHDGFVWFDGLNYNKEYLYFIFLLGNCFSGLGKWGTQLNLNTDTVGDIFIPKINLELQQQIVSFLDTKTSLIDSLIEKTQRKIELLKEKRTSLINEVVTKGLNPNVEMKDSGVEWIGEIPSHWGKGKLYQYSEMSNGSTPSRVKPEYWENGTIPWMSSGEINKKRIREIDGRITQEGFENSSTKILPVGTVMMGLNGQGKTKGTVGILEIETTCNQSLCGMIFNDDIYPMFSYYFLDSQYYHIRGLVGEGQREGISVSFLGRYPLVVPPLSEQQQIVSYLDEQTQLIDNTVSIEEKRIKFLKEYRQSLISEVVTGKQKVVNDE